MRRLFAVLFVCAASAPLSAETLSTPKRYEECLIANAALSLSSDTNDGQAAIAAASRACTYVGPNRVLTEAQAKSSAAQKATTELRRIDAITDRDFVRHASCVATEAEAIIKKERPQTIRGAASVAVRLCPQFERSHGYPIWEVLVAAHMDISQRLEAESDREFYKSREPQDNHSDLMSPAYWDNFSKFDTKAAGAALQPIPPDVLGDVEARLLGRLVNCVARHQVKAFGAVTVAAPAIRSGMSACEDQAVSFLRVCGYLYKIGKPRDEPMSEFCERRIVTYILTIAKGNNSISDFGFDMPVGYWILQKNWN